MCTCPNCGSNRADKINCSEMGSGTGRTGSTASGNGSIPTPRALMRVFASGVVGVLLKTLIERFLNDCEFNDHRCRSCGMEWHED